MRSLKRSLKRLLKRPPSDGELEHILTLCESVIIIFTTQVWTAMQSMNSGVSYVQCVLTFFVRSFCVNSLAIT